MRVKKQKSVFGKNLHAFMKDESGKMSKGNILKIGLSTLGILSSQAFLHSAHAQQPEMCISHTSHSSIVGDDHVGMQRTASTAEYDDWGPIDHSNYAIVHTNYDEQVECPPPPPEFPPNFF